MTFRCLLFALLTTVGWGLLFAQDGRARRITLQDAISLALENNETLRIARNEVANAHARIREAWADALPQINFNAVYTRNFMRPVFFFPDPITGEQRPFRVGSTNSYQMLVTFDQTLFQAGKVSGGIKAANLFKEFSDEGFRASKANLILSVKRAFYTVLLNKQLVEINRQSVEQQRAHLMSTRKLFEQGQVSELDTLRAWVDYTNLQPQVLRAVNNLLIAENQLKDLMGLDLEEAIVVVGELDYEPAANPSLEALQEEAFRNRPELRQLEFEAAMRSQNVGITRADLMPKLFLTGSYQSLAQSDAFDLGSGFQNSFFGGLRIEWPLFNGMRTSARVQQARLEYENAQYRLRLFRDQLKMEIKTIFLNLNEAAKRVEVQRHAIRQAERALFMARRRYNEGVGTQLELGDALLALNLTRTNYVQAVFDYQLALAELEKAVGRID